MDNKVVHVASNYHGNDSSHVLQTQKDGTKKAFKCPKAIVDYNKHMGGVDLHMLIVAHGLGHKSKQWWHRIFFSLIERALSSSRITYNKDNAVKLSTLEYRRSVAQSLITMGRKPKIGWPLNSPSFSGTKRRKTNYSVPPSIRKENLGVHWPIYGKKRARCEVCSKQQFESKPYIKCSAKTSIFALMTRRTALLLSMDYK